MNELVDLRSDTVTRPTPEMRRAIAEAEVGDDVFGEDPTVNRLEERAAEIMGKPASLFVPSGTMGNQIAVKVHTSPGHEMICDERSHVILYEMGGAGEAFELCDAHSCHRRRDPTLGRNPRTSSAGQRSLSGNGAYRNRKQPQRSGWPSLS